MRTCASLRRLIISALIACVCMPVSAIAFGFDLSSIKLRIDGKEAILKSPALYDGREVYLPMKVVTLLGGTFAINEREDAALITFAADKKAEIALARLGGRQMIPLSSLRQQIKLQIEVSASWCDITTITREQTKKSDERKGADVQRAESPDSAAEPKAPAAIPSKSKQAPIVAARATADSTLLIPLASKVQTLGGSTQSAPAPKPINKLKVQQPESPDDADKVPTTPNAETVQANPEIVRGALASRNGGAFAGTGPLNRSVSAVVTDVSVLAVDTRHARIKIATKGKAAPSVRLEGQPPHLVVELPNTALESERADWSTENSLVTALHVAPGDNPNSSRVTVDLARVVGYRILSVDDEGVTINLSTPRGGGGKVRDVTVVIDPGHGGPAHGTYAKFDGRTVYEKNITLSVALKLRDICRDAGMNVLMTRTDDRDVPLHARPGLANDNNADFFVSVHVDESGKSDTASGSTSYYHFEDDSSRALAHSIIEHLAMVSGLPNRRARSDRTLYNSGLSVLRNSQVPATLVELGFLNNNRDRHKLMDDRYQHMVAEAMFEGIRAYVEGGRSEGEMRLHVIKQ